MIKTAITATVLVFCRSILAHTTSGCKTFDLSQFCQPRLSKQYKKMTLALLSYIHHQTGHAYTNTIGILFENCLCKRTPSLPDFGADISSAGGPNLQLLNEYILMYSKCY